MGDPGSSQCYAGIHPPILASWGQPGTNPLALGVLASRAGAAGGVWRALLECGSE